MSISGRGVPTKTHETRRWGFRGKEIAVKVVPTQNEKYSGQRLFSGRNELTKELENGGLPDKSQLGSG